MREVEVRGRRSRDAGKKVLSIFNFLGREMYLRAEWAEVQGEGKHLKWSKNQYSAAFSPLSNQAVLHN